MVFPKAYSSFAVVFMLAGLTACQAPLPSTGSNVGSNLSPTVTFAASTQGSDASSYQADVEVYSSNSRSMAPPALGGKYRLSVKVIDKQIHSRVDLPSGDFPDGKARAILGDGSSLRLVNLDTMTTEARVALSGDETIGRMMGLMPDARSLAGYVGKADIPALVSAFRSMAFDITTENNSKGLAVALSASTLSALSRSGFHYTKAKLYYDTESSTYAGADSEIARDDGVILRVTIRPVYETHDGVLVKVGEVTQTVYDSPGVIDSAGTSVPQISDPTQVKIVSSSELSKLAESGGTLTPSTMILGDPFNPDYTVTEVSVYQNIAINTLDDAAFRIAE